MSKKHQVKRLSVLSISELANLVVTAVGHEISLQSIDPNFINISELDLSIAIVEINSYLDFNGATNIIFEELLHLILSSDYLEASIRFVCLQMLLNESVQTLVTEIFPFSYYEKILQIIAMQGRGLRYLNLKGIWVKEEHMHYMNTIIRKLPNLFKLVIPYIANDELLKHISLYSKNLHSIDVSGESDITDIGIDYLCYGLSKDFMTVIDIGALGEENVCHEDVAEILLNVHNLTSLVTYSHVGKSLLFIREKKRPLFVCKLQYLHDTETKEKTLDAIVQSCPELKLIYLDSPQEGILHKLSSLKNLQRLKLYKFNTQEIFGVLNKIGRQIQHLTMIKGSRIIDIGEIVQCCPNLVDLDFYMMDGLQYSLNYSFAFLQGLEILNSPMSATNLKYLICNTSRTLKRLAVDSVSFTDDDMSSILLDYEFNNLEDVWFTSAPNLTIVTIELLMMQLKELQSLGQLSGWKLHPDDVLMLRGLLTSGNSALILSPAHIFP